METGPNIESRDLIPLAGALRYVDKYVTGIRKFKHEERISPVASYITLGTAKIFGVFMYNALLLSASLKGLEKIIL